MTTASPPESQPKRVSRLPSAARSLFAGAIGAALALGVAALVSGSRGDDAQAVVPRASVPTLWLDVLTVVLVVIALVIVGIVIVAHLTDVDRATKVDATKQAGGSFLVVLLLLSFLFLRPVDGPPPIEPEEGGTEGVDDVERQLPPERPELDPASSMGLFLALVVVAAAVIAWRLNHFRARRWGSDPDLLDELTRAERRDHLIGLFDDEISRLRAHPDPREAVIASWSRLEDAFAVVGIDRDPSDTPMRFLAKVLHDLRASVPAVTRLTGAFEVAMFSSHEVTRFDQLEAVDALVRLRDELRIAQATDLRSRR
jgi:hypothetical protein